MRTEPFSPVKEFIVGSFRQLRNLEKSFGGDVRVCDRTALILDIFNQRAATHEASLQAIFMHLSEISLVIFKGFIFFAFLVGCNDIL